jgi:transcription initiation factor TFIIF subunit beta
MARMPRNQLLDELFALFRQQPRWSIRPLREKTQQPEVYLKEVLSEVAILHKSGEYNGLWELQEAYRDSSVRIIFFHLIFSLFVDRLNFE